MHHLSHPIYITLPKFRNFRTTLTTSGRQVSGERGRSKKKWNALRALPKKPNTPMIFFFEWGRLHWLWGACWDIFPRAPQRGAFAALLLLGLAPLRSASICPSVWRRTASVICYTHRAQYNISRAIFRICGSTKHTCGSHFRILVNLQLKETCAGDLRKLNSSTYYGCFSFAQMPVSPSRACCLSPTVRQFYHM